MNSAPALAHRPHQRAVHEHVAAVGGLGVLADQVRDRGVPVAGHGDQIGEGGLDHRGLAGAGRPVQQRGHPGRAQLAQRGHVRDPRDQPRVIQLPARAAHRPRHRPARPVRPGPGRRGRAFPGRGASRRPGRAARARRARRAAGAVVADVVPAVAVAAVGEGGGRGGRGGGVAGGGGGDQRGLTACDQRLQRVRDRARRAARQSTRDLPGRVRPRVRGQVGRDLAAQLTVAQPARPRSDDPAGPGRGGGGAVVAAVAVGAGAVGGGGVHSFLLTGGAPGIPHPGGRFSLWGIWRRRFRAFTDATRITPRGTPNNFAHMILSPNSPATHRLSYATASSRGALAICRHHLHLARPRIRGRARRYKK